MNAPIAPWAPPGQYRLVIFDFDGTLVETEALEAQIVSDGLVDLGVFVAPARVSLELTGVPARQARARLERLVGCALPEAFMQGVAQGLRAATARNLATTKGATAMLSALRQPFAVASNTDRTELARRIQVAGLAGLIGDRFLSATDVGARKPAPDIFLATADRFAVPPQECLVVEDSLAGLEAARRAGMACCAYLGGAHQSPESSRALRNQDPDFVTTSFSQRELDE